MLPWQAWLDNTLKTSPDQGLVHAMPLSDSWCMAPLEVRGSIYCLCTLSSFPRSLNEQWLASWTSWKHTFSQHTARLINARWHCRVQHTCARRGTWGCPGRPAVPSAGGLPTHTANQPDFVPPRKHPCSVVASVCFCPGTPVPDSRCVSVLHQLEWHGTLSS